MATTRIQPLAIILLFFAIAGVIESADARSWTPGRVLDRAEFVSRGCWAGAENPDCLVALLEIAAVRAKAGDQGRAKSTIGFVQDQLTGPNPPRGAKGGDIAPYFLLLRVAKAQAQAGFSNDAAATFDLAVKLANRLPDTAGSGGRASELMRIAVEQLGVGDAGVNKTEQMAYRAVDAIGEEETLKVGYSLRLRLWMLAAKARVGDKSDGSHVLNRLFQDILAASPPQRPVLLRDLACVYALRGDPKNANTVVESILKVPERDPSLLRGKAVGNAEHYNALDMLRVARALAEAGLRTDARALVEVAAKTPHLGWEVAIARAELDDIQGALAALAPANQSDGSKGVPPEIIRAQVRLGNLDAAFDLVGSVHSSEEQSGLYRDIAVAQAESGDIDSARVSAKSIGVMLDRALAFRAINAARIRGGDSPQIIYKSTLNGLSDLEQVYALVGLAEGMLEEGEREKQPS